MSTYNFEPVHDTLFEYNSQIAHCSSPNKATEFAQKLNAFDDLLEACRAANRFLADMASCGQLSAVDEWCKVQQLLSGAIGTATGPDIFKLKQKYWVGSYIKQDGQIFEIYEQKIERGILFIRGKDTIWYSVKE